MRLLLSWKAGDVRKPAHLYIYSNDIRVNDLPTLTRPYYLTSIIMENAVSCGILYPFASNSDMPCGAVAFITAQVMTALTERGPVTMISFAGS